MVSRKSCASKQVGSLLSRLKKDGIGGVSVSVTVWSLCVLLATCEDALRPRMDRWMDGPLLRLSADADCGFTCAQPPSCGVGAHFLSSWLAEESKMCRCRETEEVLTGRRYKKLHCCTGAIQEHSLIIANIFRMFYCALITIIIIIPLNPLRKMISLYNLNVCHSVCNSSSLP